MWTDTGIPAQSVTVETGVPENPVVPAGVGVQVKVIVGVNVDEKKADMDKFLAKHAVTFTIVRDANQKLVAAAEPATMPTSFVVDGAGKICFLHNGFHDEDTRKEYVAEIESLLKSNP